MTSTGLADLLSNTWGILLVIVFFCGAIFFHELGHFLAAKWRGLKIDRFSVGFGPKLFGWKGKDGVDYRVSLLPLGGYVALPQLADMRAIEGESETPKDKLPSISYADKMIVAAAGPLFNVILAFVLALVVWWVGYPQPVEFRSTTVGYVSPTIQLDADTTVASPAAKAGLRAGDKILSVDGQKVDDWEDVQKFIVTGSGRDELDNPAVNLTIERDGKTESLTLQPELREINARSGKRIRSVGIEPASPLNIAVISANSPAEAAGLKQGDQVLSVNGQLVYTVSGLNSLVEKKAGQKVTLGILRDGKPMEIQVVPEAVPMTKPMLRIIPNSEPDTAWEFIPQTAGGEGVILFNLPPSQESIASIGGLVTQVDDQPVASLEEMGKVLSSEKSDGFSLEYSKESSDGGLQYAGAYTVESVPPKTRTLIGFVVDPGTVIAHPNPLQQVRDQIEMTFLILGSLISPNSDVGLNQMSGAVGIGRVLHTFSIQDIRLALWFSVLLNINLAILNLLPIPVLDGGHMAFATISKLLRRPLPVNFIAATQGAFMVLLLGLMLYVTFNDSMDWLGDHEAEQRFLREQSYYIPLKFEPGK